MYDRKLMHLSMHIETRFKSHAYLAVGQANLTVERASSQREQTNNAGTRYTIALTVNSVGRLRGLKF